MLFYLSSCNLLLTPFLNCCISKHKNIKKGTNIDNGDVKEGIRRIFDFISYANKYFDENQPWILVKNNIEKCNEVLFNCVNIILNVNTLLKPYLPFSCEKVENYLNCSIQKWEYFSISNISLNKDIKPLYKRYDNDRIIEELENLKSPSKLS